MYEQIRCSILIGMHSFILWNSQLQSLRLYLNLCSMIHVYAYTDSKHSATPMSIESKYYTSDANGNQDSIPNIERRMYWDEDNRLMVLSNNGKTSRYTYNAAGERIMKSYGTMEGVYINGAPQGITFHETDNFTLYPASIISINKNRFTKHYFLGDKRVASRIGTGLFNNVYGRNGSYVTAGQQDYAERMNQIQKQKEAYYKQQGIAPGVPTEKGAYGDPENTGVGYNAVLTELGNHDVPQGWILTPRPNTTPNTNPGPPVSRNDLSNPDDPQAGYGYISNDTTKEETFFYHSDHLGSTSYRLVLLWCKVHESYGKYLVWSGSVGGEVYNYWWILDEANTMIVTNKKEIDIMLWLVELIVNIQMITNLLILIQSRLA